MELREALTTTGAVREFGPEAVPDEVVHRILDTARFAPSGGNRQAWRVIVVKDPLVRVRLRDLYLQGWGEYLALSQAGLVPWAPVTDRGAEAAALAGVEPLDPQSAGGLAGHLDEAPVVLVVLADLRRLAAIDRDLDRYTLVGGASIYPFAWSVLLAAHEAGLGGVMTSVMVRQEQAALESLGVPEGYALATVIALGYPAGRRPTRLRRVSVSGFTTVDRFDGPPFGG